MSETSVSDAAAQYDILIIGAGPAGLSLALSLRGARLNVCLVERQDTATLADPAYDGREIALSLRSVDVLKKIGAWDHIDEPEISPLRAAKVIDGGWRGGTLHFDPDAVGEDRLGCFVANCTIRRALYTEHVERGEATLISKAEMVGLNAGPSGGLVTLADGRKIGADLIVAADTRFSAARGMAGISAAKHDFGKVMIVTKVACEKPHDHIAWECFLPGGSIAVLPLNNNEASLAQTFSPDEAQRQMDLDIADYVDAISDRLKSRFGKMTSLTKRYAYPLIGVYADRFSRSGFALIGDAAVGMHPVTAHGFNLGVQGQSILASHIHRAVKQGRGVAEPEALAAYAREHRRLSEGFYWSTVAIAELYAKENLPAKIARRALLDMGRFVPPVRRMIMKGLTQPLPGSDQQR